MIRTTNEPRCDRRRAAGFTLIELMIAMSIFAVIVGGVLMMGRASDRAYRTGAVVASTEFQASRAMEQIVADVQGAQLESLSPDPLAGLGASAVDYVVATGLQNGELVLTPLRRLRFEYEAGELDNGLDDNGNGLVDEGMVVLVHDVGGPDELRLVLTHWVRERLEGELDNGIDDNGNGLVDEPGFLVERQGETLTVRLTLERLDPERRVMTRTAETAVHMRN